MALFWIVCGVLGLVTAALVVVPLFRTAPEAQDNPDIEIYKAQLAEIDRDLARDLLAPDEAERSRAEVARRLLAASKAAQPTARTNAPTGILTAAIIACLLAGSLALYQFLGAPGYPDLPLNARLAASEDMRANRPAQAALEAVAPAPPPVDVPDDYRAAIDQLRTIAPTRPDDLEVWSRLTFHEVELRNYAAAVDAQQRVIAILGEEAEISEFQRLLDLQVVAAGGLVSPEAEQTLRLILSRDAENTTARYYLGALYNQTDRPDLAVRFWREMVETGDPNDFHIASARSQIADAAFRAGIEYALPETRGPSFEQMDAARDMAPEDQQAMIGAMVSGLADRLANEGGPAEDWARLIRAFGVLGDTESAQAVWDEAQQVFVSSMRGMEILTNAARDAGLVE